MKPVTLTRAFARAQQGVAAIEAALVLPLMLFFIVGIVELYQYYRADAIMTRAAFSVADGLAMQPELYGAGPCNLTDHVCTYGAIMPELMRPVDYADGGQLRIRLFATQEQTTGSGKNKQTKTVWNTSPAWGRSCNGAGTCTSFTAAYQGDGMPAPNKDDTILVVEVIQAYEPFVISSRFWEALGGRRTLTAISFYRPRFDDLKNLQ
ncbi:TadE/TadG family type IV pilus assembly protein [Castellaniella sp.]|uniref:TadE/TadG family type IV pilus assembly protein n=1 Tax=Castellaniella sp. TaxID=1955812 RepID=UPI00356339B7